MKIISYGKEWVRVCNICNSQIAFTYQDVHKEEYECKFPTLVSRYIGCPVCGCKIYLNQTS